MVSRLTATSSRNRSSAEYEHLERVSLLRNEDDEDREEKEEEEAQERRPRPDPYILVNLDPQIDKLSTLSLKYNVPVAEIKRINKIFKENELFALSKVKIPVKPQSFLTESHPEVHGLANDGGWMSPPSSCTEGTLISLAGSEVSSPVLSEESELGDGGGGSSLTTPSHTPKSKQTKRVKKFLKAKDKDLELIRQKNEVLVERSGSSSSRSTSSPFVAGGGLRSTSVGALNYPTTTTAQSSSSGGGGHPKAKAMAGALLFLFITIAVIVILWFSYYENQQIEHEHPNHLEHEKHLHDSKKINFDKQSSSLNG